MAWVCTPAIPILRDEQKKTTGFKPAWVIFGKKVKVLVQETLFSDII